MSGLLARQAAGALLALTLFDLLRVIVTGAGGSGLRALVAGLLLLLRFRWLLPRKERLAGDRTLLALLLLGVLVHFDVAGGRVNGDGLSYYVFVHSIWKDADFDLANEYEHYGMLSRGDLQMPTPTGHRRTIYSVGPAVVWGPFFFVGELAARADRALGGEADLSGYGPYHRNAVALGSLLYGYAALLLIHELLRRHFCVATATLATLLVLGATFHYWYMVVQPTYAHAASAFFAALVVTLWERGRGRSGAFQMLLLGLLLGLGMSVRWQNGILLLLPAVDLALRLRQEPRAFARLVPHALALLAGTLVGALPQMLAWKAIYGVYLLPRPPQGPGFVRLHHIWFWETLFSSRHGLLSWTPVFWLGFLGLIPLLRRRPALALPLLPPFVLMAWVNMGVADYWGGASFSGRRFDSLLPIFALGFAASIDGLRGALRRRPALLLACGTAALVSWNIALAEQMRRNLIPFDDTVDFSVLARNAAQLTSDAVGFPTTWPASWLFALRHGRPGQYDLVVGRYLFYMQNNLGGGIDVGAPGDEALLADGWSGRETYAESSARRIKGRARLFASLELPEDLELRVRLVAPGDPQLVRVFVNGHDAGILGTTEGWGEARVKAPASFWQREVNEVAFEAGSAVVRVDRVDFVRLHPDERRWR